MNKTSFLNEIDINLGNQISIDDIEKELKNYICLLTRQNADLVESSIISDPRYPNKMASFIRSLNIYQKTGVSNLEIKSKLVRNKLEEFIWIVAVENSIQGKRKETCSFIADFILSNENDFYNRLRDGDWKLVEEMEDAVHNNNVNSRINRHECSWCSKVCKYLHESLFNDDKYYIYDSNVRERLNDYRKYYKLPLTKASQFDANNKKWYSNLCNSLDELREVRKNDGDDLTRNEIDHILWGYTKYPVNVVRRK